MTREEFKSRFAASPIRRTKWEGLLRNIRIALGADQKSGPAV